MDLENGAIGFSDDVALVDAVGLGVVGFGLAVLLGLVHSGRQLLWHGARYRHNLTRGVRCGSTVALAVRDTQGDAVDGNDGTRVPDARAVLVGVPACLSLVRIGRLRLALALHSGQRRLVQVVQLDLDVLVQHRVFLVSHGARFALVLCAPHGHLLCERQVRHVDRLVLRVVDDLVSHILLIVAADELEVQPLDARLSGILGRGFGGHDFGDLMVALDRVDADSASRAAYRDARARHGGVRLVGGKRRSRINWVGAGSWLVSHIALDKRMRNAVGVNAVEVNASIVRTLAAIIDGEARTANSEYPKPMPLPDSSAREAIKTCVLVVGMP